MADHKSRSRSPAAREESSRRRSRSPRRRDGRERHDKPRGSGGFKWKEKRTRDDRDGGDKRLERGYRNRSRSPRRERPQETKGPSTEKNSASVEDEFGVADKFGPSKKSEVKDKGESPKQIPASASGPASMREMIVVHVNDRLGTKAAVPCSADDTIGDFKKFVAAMIGRRPHEIMLKRQGERPFKDHIMLGDYGISNGVQIDLEIDTGE